MNESLLHLYELQKIDRKLDEVVESRGELPDRVNELRTQVEGQRANVTQVRADIKEISTRSKELSDESSDLREKVDRYKAQQYDVKTTREYDAITFQLEDGQRRLHTNVESIGRMGIELEQLKMDEEQMSAELGEMEKELIDSESALSEVLTNTEEEEKQLLARREELAAQVKPFYMTIYNRVRPAKGGIAVVAIKNGVCGGCYNAVPRRLALELRKGEKHAVCEYCGRIIVGEPIAIAVDGETVPVVYEVEVETEEVNE